MWREYVTSLTDRVTFSACADPEAVRDAERVLGVTFPEELSGLLDESDGVEGEYGLGLVWPLERIKADNLAFRADADYADLYMPFNHLLFFADAGNGDQFAFGIQNGQIRRPDVFVWNHEDDSRTWAASSLKQYLEWWITGKLTA